MIQAGRESYVQFDRITFRHFRVFLVLVIFCRHPQPIYGFLKFELLANVDGLRFTRKLSLEMPSDKDFCSVDM